MNDPRAAELAAQLPRIRAKLDLTMTDGRQATFIVPADLKPDEALELVGHVIALLRDVLERQVAPSSGIVLPAPPGIITRP